MTYYFMREPLEDEDIDEIKDCVSNMYNRCLKIFSYIWN